MAYEAIITTIGLARIADAIANNTPLNLTTMKIGDGDGSATTPSASDTDLVNVVYSDAPSRIDIDPEDETRIICELTVPASEGGWTAREIGVFDDDDNLIAISQLPEIAKPTAAEGATLDLVCRLFFTVSNTDAITLFIDSSVVIATRSWVTTELNNLIPGGTTDQILTKVSNTSGDYEWRDPTDVNVTVETIEEEITLTSGQTVVNFSTVTTDNLALYVQGLRLKSTQYSITTETQITLTTGATAGHVLHAVQNEPNGATQFLARGQNLADVPDKSAARANLELLTSTSFLDNLWKLMNQRQYPVGEIYTTRRAGNPSTLLGFGTWERYAEGRVLVGYDEADASFNAQDKTGGAKTHVLTTAEMPAHTHSNIVALSTKNDFDTSGGDSSGVRKLTSQTGSTGGGQAHNNLQPYITVFMWKRTA